MAEAGLPHAVAAPVTPAATAPRAPAPAPKVRDLRLDFFRGVSLIFIFLNHIPDNVVSWISNRNYGFSDATEVFVFISGYSVFLAYSGAMQKQGFVVGMARIWKRVWQIYTAHIFLFIIFVAQIAWLATRYNEALAEEMNIGPLFEAPQVLMLQALILKFKPVNMDVLPMYIALMATFPPVMWLMMRRPALVLATSFVLWFVVQFTHWNLPAYPHGGWFFNPFAWQFLFILGAWCAMRRHAAPWLQLLPRRPVTVLAVLYLLFSFLIVLTWLHQPWSVYIPRWLARVLYPIDKTEMDVWRLLHFFAQAWLVILLVRPESRFLTWRIAQPLVLCGQHSLHVFCAGIFLSFAAHFLLSEIARGLLAQVAVSLAGIVLMVALAGLLKWYKQAEGGKAAGGVGS
ncbi:OpgC family protein [Ferrovibrio xuzhouensis]|uniref:OpgC family protein n=1 Tax=Ferrovibrio xuzhouensis TaxID=1576914 RepID=A0ABV7VG95_9PROT